MRGAQVFELRQEMVHGIAHRPVVGRVVAAHDAARRFRRGLRGVKQVVHAQQQREVRAREGRVARLGRFDQRIPRQPFP
jgi:hypothetical protein